MHLRVVLGLLGAYLGDGNRVVTEDTADFQFKTGFFLAAFPVRTCRYLEVWGLWGLLVSVGIWLFSAGLLKHLVRRDLGLSEVRARVWLLHVNP